MSGDRLFFYSASANPSPGRGVHEQVSDPVRYRALGARPGWRRMLSNFWCADFTLGGRTWRTVEHCFQATKIALADETVAFRFALESGSDLARGDGAEARKHRKLAILTPAQISAWDATKHDVMRMAMLAKFTQHRELGVVLLATRDAELWHSAGRGQAPQRVFDLESVRTEIRANATAALQADTPLVSPFNARLFEALVLRGINPDDLRVVVHTYLLDDGAGHLLTARYVGGDRPAARAPGRREFISEEQWGCDLWDQDVQELEAAELAFLLGLRVAPAAIELVDIQILDRQSHAAGAAEPSLVGFVWRVRGVDRSAVGDATDYHEELRWVPTDAGFADVGAHLGLARLASPDVEAII